MGSVFEAQHEALGTTVALKFLHPELSRRQGLVQRFLQEARVSAKIQSPHVVRVTDVEQTSTGLAFIVMEFLKGTSLQSLYEDLYRAGKRLSFDEAIDYSLQMLDGLEAAHEEGIIHRDLKPDNVMITKGKRGEPIVKLCDFGIAKLKINGELYKGLTRPGVIMGTPEYMAPEQVFSADQVDVRADIFSCGVMIFEMLAGRRPVGGDEPHQIAAQYLAGSVARLTELAPHVPAELAAAVHKAMSADPKDRFESVADFRQAILPFSKAAVPAGRVHSTPPPAAAGDRRSVPKTIPPHADEAPAVNADNAATDQMSKPFPSAAQAQNGSGSLGVLGERTLDGPFGAAELPAVQSAKSSHPANHPRVSSSVLTPGGMAIPANAGTPHIMESTVEGAPFYPGATEAFDPLNAQRPGGTNIGDAAAIAGTVGYDAPYAPARATPAFAAVPNRTSAAPAFQMASAAPRAKKSSFGVGAILAAAAAVAALTVGGVFLYSQHGTNSNGDDTSKPLMIPTSAPQTTSPAVQEPEPSQPQVKPQPVSPQPVSPAPVHPKPQGTTQPKPQPQTPPPFMVPSSFQIPGLELPPPPWQPQPQPNPEEPKGRPRIPPIGEIFHAPPASPSATPPSGQQPSTAPSGTTPHLRIPAIRLPGVRRAMR